MTYSVMAWSLFAGSVQLGSTLPFPAVAVKCGTSGVCMPLMTGTPNGTTPVFHIMI